MASDCMVVKDANSLANDDHWLEEQLSAAVKNLAKRPAERRGPYEVSDEVIEHLSRKYFSTGLLR